MTGLEVSPGRGPADSVFTFTITDAPLVEKERPPFRHENMAVLYVEAPNGTVAQFTLVRKNCTVRMNPTHVWDPLPPPAVVGWERFLAFVYPWDALYVPGADVVATPSASAVMLLDQYTDLDGRQPSRA